MPSSAPAAPWHTDPAQWAALAQEPHVLGVDGCPHGWVLALLSLETNAVTLGFVPHFDQVIAHRSAHAKTSRAVVVDMPIGLRDWGRRACETEARKTLKRRSSSIFACPRRPMLDFETYEQANAWGKSGGKDSGGGLSKQAWFLLPKIREIDDLITPTDQDWLCEGHPEVAFTRVNGAPCSFPKSDSDGLLERQVLLARAGLRHLGPQLEATRSGSPFRHSTDDLLDALIMAVTAKARIDGDAWCLGDDQTDARGLKMQIWG
ncbi:MAG: DUF429 domain-containing protein [Pseudomonadota bacterium]